MFRVTRTRLPRPADRHPNRADDFQNKVEWVADDGTVTEIKYVSGIDLYLDGRGNDVLSLNIVHDYEIVAEFQKAELSNVAPETEESSS